MNKAFGGFDVMWNNWLNHWMVDYDIIRVLKFCGYWSWAEGTTNRRSFVSKITMQRLIFLYGILVKKNIKQYVSTWNYKIMFEFKLQDNQRKEHYIPKRNFMLKMRKMLNLTFQPGILRLCSSSSYKIINGKNIIFQIGILCWRQILQEIQDKIEEKLCLIEIVWCLGLSKGTIWLNGNYWLNFVSIAWSWFIAQEWKMT